MKRERLKYVVWFSIQVIFLLLSACATSTTVTVTGNTNQPMDSCNIQFFNHSKPSSSYETLAKIESHVQKNMFFGRTAKLEDDTYDELRQKACAIGANAVVINDYVESTAAEFSHVHVWASAIKLNRQGDTIKPVR
ncbi:MAG: hypothetical protein WCK63_13845 [Betaproteobacteria bacterium]